MDIIEELCRMQQRLAQMQAQGIVADVSYDAVMLNTKTFNSLFGVRRFESEDGCSWIDYNGTRFITLAE